MAADAAAARYPHAAGMAPAAHRSSGSSATPWDRVQATWRLQASPSQPAFVMPHPVGEVSPAALPLSVTLEVPETLPTLLSAALNTAGACSGCLPLRTVERKLRRSSELASQALGEAVQALLELNKATRNIRQDDDTKRKLKTAKLQVRDVVLWRCFGLQLGMLDKAAIDQSLEEALGDRADENHVSQLSCSYSKIQEHLLRELLVSSFFEKLRESLEKHPERSMEKDPELYEILCVRGSRSSPAAWLSDDSGANQNNLHDTQQAESKPQPELEAEGERDQGGGGEQAQQLPSHMSSALPVQNTFLHFGGGQARGVREWRDYDSCITRFHRCDDHHDWSTKKSDYDPPKLNRHGPASSTENASAMIAKLLINALATETEPQNCAELARGICDKMCDDAELRTKAEQALLHGVAHVAQHEEELLAVLHAFSVVRGAGFLRRSIAALQECSCGSSCHLSDLHARVLCDVWAGHLQAADVEKSGEKGDAAMKLLEDSTMLLHKTKDALTSKKLCTAIISFLTRCLEQLRDQANLAVELNKVQSKLHEVLTELWTCAAVEDHTLNDCIWEMAELRKHKGEILGLSIDRCEPVRLMEEKQQGQVTQLVADLEKSATQHGGSHRPATKLYQLYARSHKLTDILTTLGICASETVSEHASKSFLVVLQEAFTGLDKPVEIFIQKCCDLEATISNEEELSTRNPNRLQMLQEQTWAENVLHELLKQRSSHLGPALIPVCTTWLQFSCKRTSTGYWKDHFDLRKRFFLIGVLFGESQVFQLVRDLKEDAHMMVGAVRSLQDLHELLAFEPGRLAEGLELMLSLDFQSQHGALRTALASGMGHFASSLGHEDFSAKACQKLLLMSNASDWLDFNQPAFMSETSWALAKMLSKCPCVASVHAVELKTLSEQVRDKYRREACAVKYALELEQLLRERA